MGKRSQYEISLLSKRILKEAKKQREAIINSPVNKKKIADYPSTLGLEKESEELRSIAKQIRELNERKIKVGKKIQKVVPTFSPYYVEIELIFNEIAKKALFPFKHIDIEEIETDIVLAGDEGGDILVKKLSEQLNQI